MFRVILIAILALASVSAFKPVGSVRKASMQLSMKKGNSIPKFVLPAAMMPFVAPLASFAAEGTGRAFGIDDNRLVAAALLPSFIIFPLYLKWSNQQDGDDFFDGYEKRRQG